MPYDLLIKNGKVVDGTGAPPHYADVAVESGKIVEIGAVSGHARQVIDASDLIVSPGFIDPHTHYDAQICWDPLFTCSSWHGVTSVIMGNCGVGLAPCRPETREMTAWDLVNVEGIPFEVLSQGVTWDWVSFPQYMDAAAKRGLGLNAGFLAPLTPFRHFVMGEDSIERIATREETVQIKALLKEAMIAGALGFTSSHVSYHVGYQGRRLGCHTASREELTAYCNVLKELGRGTIEVALVEVPWTLSESEAELLDLFLTESGRPVTWLGLFNREDQPGACQETLRRVEPLIRRKGVPQVSCRPMIVRLDLHAPFFFANLPSWNSAFNRTVEEQKRLYRDPAFRQAFREDLKKPQEFSGRWELVEINEVANPAMKSLEGKTVAEVASMRGKDALDTFLDLAIEDDLKIQFTTATLNTNEEEIPALISDPRTLVALSDGGAHVDMLCDVGYCTHLIGKWVRDKGALSLEYAIKRITSEPADFFGINGRGRLAKGMAADITIFDYQTIDSAARAEMRADLPGGGRRLVMPAQGIQYTIVNGVVLYEHGKHTGAMPGQVLRSSEHGR